MCCLADRSSSHLVSCGHSQQKAAKQRKHEAAALTTAALAEDQAHSEFARTIATSSLSIEWKSFVRRTHLTTPKQWRRKAKACIRLLQLLQQERQQSEIAPTLVRICAGLLTVQSCAILQRRRMEQHD